MASGSRSRPPCRRRSTAPCTPSPSKSARRSSTSFAAGYRGPKLKWRGLGYLEALPRFHLLHPVLQFRVLCHWCAAVRHVAEVIEQRDHHQIGEADMGAGEEPMVFHQAVEFRKAEVSARQGRCDRRLVRGAAEKTRHQYAVEEDRAGNAG